MLVANSYVGHRDEEAVADRLAAAEPERVVLSDTDRRRSRVRTETVDGNDLGIVVGDDLEDGDVLETESGRLVVIELAEIEALVIEFDTDAVSVLTALELGHALGNRHWDLAVRETAALFPVTDSRERMKAAIADILPDGASTHFETVPPTTFDDGGPEHSHTGDAHSHGDHSHGHSHDDHEQSLYTIGEDEQ